MKKTTDSAKKHKQNGKEAHKQKVIEKYREKDYYDEYIGTRNASRFAAIFAQFVSAGTMLYITSSIINSQVGNAAYSTVLAVLLVGFAEYVKREITGIAMKQAAQKMFSVFQVIALVLFIGSVYISYKGANEAGKTATKPTYVAADIETEKERIKQLTELIADAKKSKWKGVITSDARRDIRNYESLRTQATKQLQDKKESAKEEHAAKVSSWENENTTVSRLVFFTLLCELVFFLSMYFLFYFDYRVYEDSTTILSQTIIAPLGLETESTESVEVQSVAPRNTPLIGFRQKMKPESENKKKTRTKTTTNASQISSVRTYYRRASTSKSETARKANRKKYEQLKSELEKKGVIIIEQTETQLSIRIEN